MDYEELRGIKNTGGWNGGVKTLKDDKKENKHETGKAIVDEMIKAELGDITQDIIDVVDGEDYGDVNPVDCNGPKLPWEGDMDMMHKITKRTGYDIQEVDKIIKELKACVANGVAMQEHECLDEICQHPAIYSVPHDTYWKLVNKDEFPMQSFIDRFHKHIPNSILSVNSDGTGMINIDKFFCGQSVTIQFDGVNMTIDQAIEEMKERIDELKS